jgi:hypothetical protein
VSTTFSYLFGDGVCEFPGWLLRFCIYLGALDFLFLFFFAFSSKIRILIRFTPRYFYDTCPAHGLEPFFTGSAPFPLYSRQSRHSIYLSFSLFLFGLFLLFPLLSRLPRGIHLLSLLMGVGLSTCTVGKHVTPQVNHNIGAGVTG